MSPVHCSRSIVEAKISASQKTGWTITRSNGPAFRNIIPNGIALSKEVMILSLTNCPSIAAGSRWIGLNIDELPTLIDWLRTRWVLLSNPRTWDTWNHSRTMNNLCCRSHQRHNLLFFASMNPPHCPTASSSATQLNNYLPLASWANRVSVTRSTGYPVFEVLYDPDYLLPIEFSLES